MRPCLGQVSSLSGSFEDDIDGFADAAGSAIELWLTKLETYLQARSIAEVSTRAADRGLTLAAASFQGGILLSQGESRREAWSQFERRLDLCQQLCIPTLVVTADFLGPFDAIDIERAQVSLAQAGQEAAKRGVRIAVEFQARNTFVNNLETCVMLVDSVGQANVGVCLDLFHYFVGPSKHEDLGYLSARNLFHVQISDVADRPRELATDSDRILPGDGDFAFAPVLSRLRSIGYDGYVSLELLNPRLWTIPARSVGEIGLTALRKVLGQATTLEQAARGS
jgi:4-hydroxyphenylpyruvate dioxygenase